ncbi:MAG: S-methyl-5-thioribose kinase [Sulfurovum sp.]
MKSTYQILTKESIVAYLLSIENIRDYFGDDADLRVDEIGDGNLNFVFIIKSKTNTQKALILKQAVPYLRCAGEGYALSRERMTFEIRALTHISQITPDAVPFIYHSDEDMSIVVMEFLADCTILRYEMIEGEIFVNLANHISTYLANNLFYTSSLYLNSSDKRALVDEFNHNIELCKLTEDFVFTTAFMPHETNEPNSEQNPQAQKLFGDMEFKKAVLGLKYKFMTQNDALLHGDLHTGSIMVNDSKSYVIDPEFAFVGAFGFDIGAFIGNMIMSYNSHSDMKYKEWILDTIVSFYKEFEKKFLALWSETSESALLVDGFIDREYLDIYKKEFILNIFQESLGFAGCKMARRMFGIAGVADIRDMSDESQKQKAIEKTLTIATHLVKNYTEIKNIEEVIEVIIDADKI